jgi:DNA helicase-2/ATP-dependent DNA helicase PcrA
MEEQNESPEKIYEKILHESGYWDFLKASKDYESLARLENLEELASAIKQFEDDESKPSLTGFLETVTLDQNVDDESQSSELGEVSLMTVHGAKGLEFPYVFVTGVEENIFPSYRSLDEGEFGEEEERRLFYVAMTRAMKQLTLTFAQGRMLFGQVKFNGPSRFLQEIPKKFCEWKGNSGTAGLESVNSMQSDWSEEDFVQDSYDDEEIYEVRPTSSQRKSSYPKGSRVKHSLYGEGKITSTVGLGEEEVVTIKFNDGAMKMFSVKFAPLSLI